MTPSTNAWTWSTHIRKKRALHTHKRALHKSKRDLYLYLTSREGYSNDIFAQRIDAVCTQKSPEFCQKNPMYIQKCPANPQQSPTYIQKRATFVFIWHRVMTVQTASPSSARTRRALLDMHWALLTKYKTLLVVNRVLALVEGHLSPPHARRLHSKEHCS